MNYLKLLPVLSVFAFPAMAVAQYPIIFNHVKYISISQDACIRRAEIAAQDSGFDSNFEPLANGAFGVNGNYSVSIRCEAKRGVVFFAVAGPDNRTSSNLVKRVQKAF
ncbi:MULTISPECIES: hypothetical protein [Pseudanabaena]|jgi:hypothetical protein|uniref:hypothetical protein n=1 Tax=Pseudanabaena TaxID=1152 RepID=UPI002479C6E9|nr:MULTISPECIES: hypothetical protein [Pseudanabaena]MEA5488379.1 hypothetical protein [Pseudanabaena sp. CCNP1317]WGS72798.1 hypothetical protein OA858_01850 [Pseudanabaena galeata CCNP1313]